MKRIETWLLIVGWAGAIFVPIVGVIAGLYVQLASSRDPEGLRVLKYDRRSRAQALGMIVVALLVVTLGLVLNYRHR